MAKIKKVYDPKKLKGMSIYQEEKRTVYSPFFTKYGYVVSQSTCRAYTQYVQGYLISLFIFALAYIISKNIWVSLGLGTAFFLGTLLAFYLNFIKKAVLIKDYKKHDRDSFFVRQAKSLPAKNIITIIVACFLLTGMIMLNGYINKFAGAYFILNTVLAAVALLYGFMHIYILIYKKKNNLKE